MLLFVDKLVVCVIVKHAVFESLKSNFKSTNDYFMQHVIEAYLVCISDVPSTCTIRKQCSPKHFEIFVTLAASC